MSQQQTVRRFILTGGIAAITATGAIYGAGLKSRQEVKKERRQIVETSLESRIEDMAIAKSRLLRTRRELEAKIAEIQARRQRQESGTQGK